jgi:recombination protein RecA
MARKTTTKKATKAATRKATPKRKSKTSPAKRASQLEVMTRARAHFGSSKQFGEQLIVMDELDNTVPGFVSTQSLALDYICGNGGVPQSRIVDATGDEGVGKSTFGDHLMAEVQRIGGHSYLWDTENARDVHYQKRIGIVRRKSGQITSPTMEDGFELMIQLIAWHNEHDQGRPGIIVWDTPAGTPTRAEANPDLKDEMMGPAKLIRSYLRKLNQELMRSRWILCVINQTYLGRSQSGQAFKAAYGGGGIPYYSSVRLSFSHPSKQWASASAKEMKLPPVGQLVWVNCVKNRVSMPHRSRQIYIEFGHGIDNTYEVFNELHGAGCIALSGSWYSFDADGWPELAERWPKSWQGGWHALAALCKEDHELWVALLKAYHELGRVAADG